MTVSEKDILSSIIKIQGEYSRAHFELVSTYLFDAQNSILKDLDCNLLLSYLILKSFQSIKEKNVQYSYNDLLNISELEPLILKKSEIAEVLDYPRETVRRNINKLIDHDLITVDKKNIIETGNILYANLKLSGVDNSLYYFDSKNNEGHYDKSGKSVQKALMKTPINGARLSSPFGMRKHPIDGFNKMHRGTDFAAPMGTPIMASGNGVIKKAGWCGGGGNCVVIKHNSTYQTVYAHMSKFAKGIRKGTRVKQGQTIGYVGSTGKSTGPHLHYEVIVNGEKINSQTLKFGNLFFPH